MSRKPRVVVLGGGTGTYTALVGLKRHPLQLAAVVSMADDGGSSGRLRDEFGHLPPGDVRRCLLALSKDDSSTLVRQLFAYRFSKGNGLSGHTIGNLLLTALREITGETDLAIHAAAQILNVRGEVLPATLSDCRLCAELDDGTIVCGESNIDIRTEKPEHRIRRVYLEREAQGHPEAIRAIREADKVVIGPGDLYTSIIPVLLVQGIAEAIVASGGRRIYVCNIMTKHGETDGFRASDFLREVLRYLGDPRGLDCAIVNDDASLPPDRLGPYALERAFPVAADAELCRSLVPSLIIRPLAQVGSLLRHGPELLAEAILSAGKLSAGNGR